jgi:hypothetical protein
MRCNWATKTLKFDKAGHEVVLKGMPSKPLGPLQEMPVGQLLKLTKGNDIWAIVVLLNTDSLSESSPLPPEIQTVLEQFSSVFAEPQGLSPHRDYDHAILLQPDAMLVNARPYRYSSQHKDEIERQVTAMLQAVVIVPSMSSFASPVLLVQKKDGEWRFCIDYNCLNELTIKNTFPMAVIDKLLDELAGAKFFSKLDL